MSLEQGQIIFDTIKSLYSFLIKNKGSFSSLTFNVENDPLFLSVNKWNHAILKKMNVDKTCHNRIKTNPF